ncbi:choice-of-anchor B family protein [Candidatus Marinimicrobia bacterium MT.SAG.3]|nr:choice-of-anchor B family protein [Candidatus Marinimicrobia bacterium MT.SAG.3]
MKHSTLACLINRFTIFFLAPAISLATWIAPQQAKAQESWNVTLVGHLHPSSSNYADVWGYVDSSGTEYALLATHGDVWMIDLSEPENPTVVSTFGNGIDIKTFDHYVVTSGGGIYDVADVTNPVLVGTFPAAHNIFVSYPYLFLACSGDGVELNQIYDITRPLAPVFVRDYGSDCHDVTVINDTLYNAGGFIGIEIFDISDINNHVLLTSFRLENLYSHNVWPTEDRKYLLLTDEAVTAKAGFWGLTIWDIQDMSSPMMVAQYKIRDRPNIHNVYVRGDHAYISHYVDGLRILDIADPTNPVEVGFYDTFPGSDDDIFFGAFGTYPFLPSGLILISDTDSGLYVVRFDSVEVDIVGEESGALQQNFTLYQNHPNPFNPETVIEYELPMRSEVSLIIYNLRGEEVVRLVKSTVPAGNHRVSWDASNVSSGIYFYRLQAGDFVLTRKMVLLK